MSSVIHIAEVAAILAVAYVVGWAIGYLAHRVLAKQPATATVPAERIAAVTGAHEPLVVAPVIDPVPSAPPPVVPAAAPSEPAVEPVAGAESAVPLAPAPEPAHPTAAPALRPGEAWSGEVRGRGPAVVKPAAGIEVEPVPQMDVPLTIDLGPVGPDSTYGEPMMPAPVDEDAAMRAIEGGWSRTKARALPDSPELADVGAAVAAAQSAVEQVLAQSEVVVEHTAHAGRPAGLPRPRDGRKDDLKQIGGLGALDESTLNNLGVYHYDQIAAWDEAEVQWMEDHVFARGRIGRENWQQQAKDLAG